MKDKDYRAVESILSIAQFVERDGDRVPEIATLGRRITQMARQLEVLRDREFARTRQGDVGEHLRQQADRLRTDYMLRISRAAKKLLKFKPGIQRALETPPKRATPERIASAAIAMEKAVRGEWRLFTAIGLRRTMLAEMKVAATAVAKDAKNSDWARRDRTKNLAELGRVLGEARGVRDVMDAMMLAPSRADPVLGAAWRRAKRIPKRLGRPKAKKPAPTSAPQPIDPR